MFQNLLVSLRSSGCTFKSQVLTHIKSMFLRNPQAWSLTATVVFLETDKKTGTPYPHPLKRVTKRTDSSGYYLLNMLVISLSANSILVNWFGQHVLNLSDNFSTSCKLRTCSISSIRSPFPVVLLLQLRGLWLPLCRGLVPSTSTLPGIISCPGPCQCSDPWGKTCGFKT